MFTRAVLVLALICFALSILRAQENDPAPAEQPAADEKTPAAPDTPEQKEYAAVLAEWKDGLKQLREYQIKYQQADAVEKAKLEGQFNALRAEMAEKVQPRLIAAAKKAYEASPQGNGDLANFLTKVTADYVNQDKYDETLQTARLLLESGAEAPQLHLYAGLAAYSTHDFEYAKEQLEKAQEADLLKPPAGRNVPEFRQRMVQLGQSSLGTVDEYIKLWEKEQEIRAAEAEADDLPRVKLETTAGDIVLELFENEAPNTVANFISLVEKGFYDNVIFHRVLPGFMAQGGDPEGTGSGGPGYVIKCECHEPDHRKHFRGTISMAHAGRNTGGSQFFLTFRPTPHLNERHTAFGRIVEGMDVLAELPRVDPNAPDPSVKPDKIVKATVVRKRPHPYVPETMPE